MPQRRRHQLACALFIGMVALAAPAAEPKDPIRSVLLDCGIYLPTIQPLPPAPNRNETYQPHPLDQDIGMALHAVRRAEGFITKGRMVKAASKFQEILDSPATALLLPAGRQVHLPAWQYCMTRILTGPSGLRRSYRALYEVAARNTLAAAMADRETAALWDVVYRYGAAKAAADALDALAAVQLERDNALAAAHALELRLAMERPSDKATPRLLAKLAVALARADRRQRLADLAGALRSHAPDISTETGGKAVRLTKFTDALLAQVQRDADLRKPGPAPRPATLLWQIPLAQVPAASPRRRRRQPIALRLASLGPIMQNGVVYSQIPGGLRSVVLASGRELPTVSLGGSYVTSTGRRPLPGRPSHGTGITTPALYNAADGPALIAATPTAYTHQWNRFRRSSIRTGGLSAVALPTARSEGKVLWSLSTLSKADPEDSFRFVSSPAVTNGVVAIGARRSQNETRAFLLGYDAATGRTLWRTHVATGSWVNPGIRITQGPDGAPPAMDDGLAYYCSDQGTVAAVDLGNGSLRWLTQYAQQSPFECELRTIGGARASITAPPNRPILAGRTLFVLPADSKHLIALDTATGAVKWRRSRSLNGAVGLFLLAADSERVYVSGSAVMCFDARTGALLWRSVLLDSFPVGRGVVARDNVMVPVEGSIAMIDIPATGRLAEPVNWKTWRRNRVGSGNLTILDGRLLVARDDSPTLFAGDNWGDIIRAHIKRSPQNPKHHADLGTMHAALHDWASATAAFEKARKLQLAQGKPTGATDAALLDAYRQVAAASERAERWGEATTALTKAIALGGEKTPETALLFLRKARGQTKSSEPRAALQTLHAVIEQFAGVDVRMPNDLSSQMNGVAIAANIPAALQIATLVKQHGPAIYAEYERAATAAATNDHRPPSHVIQRWPNSSSAADLRFDQAARAIGDQRLTAASSELLAVRRLCHAHDAVRAAKLSSELAAARAHRLRQPTPDKPGGTPKLLWHTPGKRAAAYRESVADLGARASGRYTGQHLFVANGKSLKAHNLADGKLLWETGAGWLGVRYQAPTSAQAGARRAALEIHEALPDQPAEKAGVKAGDLLLSFDGHPIRHSNALVQFCATTQPGTKVKLEILREGRRLMIEVVLGRVPKELSGTPLRPRRVAPQEFIRIVGIEGEHIIADVDLALLWINRQTGRVERRAIIAPYTDEMAVLRLYNHYSANLRRYQQLRRRGGRPVLGDGGIFAPTPQGTVECLDLSGRRRWSVRLAALHGKKATEPAPALIICQTMTLPGRVAVITAILGEGRAPPKPKLTILDAFSGTTLLSKDLPPAPHLDRYQLIAAGEKLVVFVPPAPGRHGGTFAAHDLSGNKEAWTTTIPDEPEVRRLPQRTPYAPILAGSKLLMPASQSKLVAVDAVSGKTTWEKQLPGAIRHVVSAKDRAYVVYARLTRGRAPACAVAAIRLADGAILWDKETFNHMHPRSADAVSFARVSAGRLVLVLQLNDRRGNFVGWPFVAVVGANDGSLLGTIGMAGARRYNVRGGRWGFVGLLKDGVIGLIGDTGVMGISFDK